MRRAEGQTLVEFSIAITVFLAMLIGIFDLGRAVFLQSGVNQAAREIARATSVHPGSTLGDSPESAEAVAIQQRLVPGLAISSISCVDIAGDPVSGSCQPGHWVRVRVGARFSPALPLLMAVMGSPLLTASSSAEIE